ncbi:MAG: HAD family hydrolase [Sandaracinaceae bacterium]|nr:HAD family hydrolase [Sandaracinaceae bacterium]
MKAAFFDLDRTLVRVNTAPLYVRWQIRQKKLGWADYARVSWWGLQYTLGVLDPAGASEKAVVSLRGIEEETFRAECLQWAHDEVMPLVTDRARDEVARRRDEGCLLAVLTSTTRYVADPVADALGVEHVLCSRIDVDDGRFTGQLTEPLCYGPRKVDRARDWAKEHGVDLEASSFYTDSVSDLPMLEVVGEPRVINPDPRLRQVARRRGWSIETWA